MSKVQENIDFLRNHDEEVADSIKREFLRQNGNIELIASENIVSEAVLSAMGSILTNKYAEGYPSKRYYGGCEYVDEIEDLARQRACRLFGAEHANVQPHSGSQANTAVYFAFLKPGDTVLGMNLSEGGHLTHGSKVNLSGKFYNFVSYGVDPTTHLIDYEKTYDIAKKNKPKMIVCGASAYPRKINFKKFKEIADSVGAYLMVDMAHIAGLVACGLHENPVPYADFVTSTTHKTLRGPRGGLILCKEKYAKQIDKAIFPGIQGGPLMHIIAGKAVCFKEALAPEFKIYMKQVLANCKTLEKSLAAQNIKMVSGGSDNHLILVDLSDLNVTGKEIEERLDSVKITVNKNTVPNEKRSPTLTSGIRIGTPAVTTRGMKETDMEKIANFIAFTINDYENKKEYIKEEVSKLCEKYPIYK